MRLASALLLSVVACARERVASSAEELLPDAAQGAVVTAPLAAVAQDWSALLGRVATTIPGGERAGEWRRGLAAQLGFDPLSRDGQLAAGLDPDRAAALVLLPGATRRGWIAALPLAKREVFSQTVDRLLRERAAFAARQDEQRGKTRMAVYTRPGEAERIAVAVVRGYGLVARGADPAADIAAAADRRSEQSLAHDPKLAAARKRLGGQHVVVIAPPGSALGKLPDYSMLAGAEVGLTGTKEGVAAKLFFALSPEDARRMQAEAPGGGGALIRFLPRDAPLLVRAGLQPADVLREARRLPQLALPLDRLGGSVLNEIAASLLPGGALSVALGPHANLAALVDFGVVDWRRRSPFDSIQVVALAPVGDRARLERALEAVAKELPRLGGQASRTTSGWQVRYPGGEGPRFGIRELGGKPVAYVTGGIDPAQLGGEAQRSAPLEQDAGGALLLDLAKLAETVRRLPETAYGSGPQAYVARSIVSQLIEPLSVLRMTASVLPGADGVAAEIGIAFAPGTP